VDGDAAGNGNDAGQQLTTVDEGPTGGAVPVEVAMLDGRYTLLRGGEPYTIRGAGIEFADVGIFAAHGGNSLRTWRTDNRLYTGQ